MNSKSKGTRSLRDHIAELAEAYLRYFRTVDFFLLLSLTLISIVAVNRGSKLPVVLEALAGKHQVFYVAITSIGGTLVGFIIAAIAIVLSYSQMERFSVLIEADRLPELFSLYYETVAFLGLNMIAGFVGMAVDTDSSPNLTVTLVTLGLSLLCTSRVVWCVIVLKAMTDKAIAQGRQYAAETTSTSVPRLRVSDREGCSLE